jgi:undecaprenyl-diphosphatase
MNERQVGHPLAALLVSLGAAGLFGATAWLVHTPSAVTSLDTRIAEAMHEYQATHPAWNNFFTRVSYAGSVETLLVVALVASVALFRMRQIGLTVIWIVVITGGELLNRELKHLFERPRPPFTTAREWSFPSGHAMMSLIAYGMLAYVLVVLRPGWLGRIVPVIVLVLLIGFSRIFLTVHYLSDVIGGYAAGAAWLGVWIAALETIRRAMQPRAL